MHGNPPNHIIRPQACSPPRPLTLFLLLPVFFCGTSCVGVEIAASHPYLIIDEPFSSHIGQSTDETSVVHHVGLPTPASSDKKRVFSERVSKTFPTRWTYLPNFPPFDRKPESELPQRHQILLSQTTLSSTHDFHSKLSDDSPLPPPRLFPAFFPQLGPQQKRRRNVNRVRRSPEQVLPVRVQPQELLRTANPTTATYLGGQVLGGASLLGNFYPLTTVSPSALATEASTAFARPTPTSLIPSQSSIGGLSTSLSNSILAGPLSATLNPLLSNPLSTSASTSSPGLPISTVIAIAVGVLLIVLLFPLLYLFMRRSRRRRQEKLRTQRDSFISNPIMNTANLATNSSNASTFRGTPYRGDQQATYYNRPGSPSIESSLHSYAFSSEESFSDPNGFNMASQHSDSDRVEYLEVRALKFLSRPQERFDSLKDQMAQEESLVGNLPGLGHQRFSIGSRDSESFCQRGSIRQSGFRDESFEYLAVPAKAKATISALEAAVMRSGPKNDAPTQILPRRIHSQVAMTEVSAYPHSVIRDSQSFDRVNFGNGIPSFYLHRSGDPRKTSYQRSILPHESLPGRATNFSKPMPRFQHAESLPRPPPRAYHHNRYSDGSESLESDEDSELDSPAGRPEPRLGSTATPSFANNRYIPDMSKKKTPNAKVLSVFNNSRKLSVRVVSGARSQVRDKRHDTIDIPDPLARFSLVGPFKTVQV